MTTSHQRPPSLLAAVVTPLLLLAPGSLPPPALECGAVITGEVRLTADLECEGSGPALTIAGGGSLDLGGFSVACVGAERGIGLQLVGRHATVHSGAVRGCFEGVRLGGDGEHEVSSVTGTDNRVSFLVEAASAGNFLLRNESSGGMDGFQVAGPRNRVLSNRSTGGRAAFVVTGDDNHLLGNEAGPTNEAIVVAGARNTVRDNLVAGRIYGLYVRGVDARLQRNQVDGAELLAGIYLSADATRATLVVNTVTRCVTAIDVAGQGHRLVANELRDNQAGLVVRAGADDLALHGNHVAGSAGFDLADENPGCAGNAWSGNRFESANQPCIH